MPSATTIELVAGQGSAKLNQQPSVSLLNEADIWQSSQGGWQRVYGNLHEEGVSIEWHDFELDTNTTYEWSRGFCPDSLELCLNLEGHGFILCGENSADFEPMTAGLYASGKNELQAWRKLGERHRFITVKFSSCFICKHLSQCNGALHALVERFMSSNSASAGLGEIHQLSAKREQLIAQLLHPNLFQGARQLWYQGMVLQLMADFFFARCCPNELFCERQKRMPQERVERVVDILRRNLAGPPTLGEIGREIGCSPYHLSRTFSREMGMTIPQCLRKLRMQCAAELLRSGKCNVTEAAMEVGYSSLSHFSQAFCQTMGCCPALYSLKTPVQKVCSRKSALGYQ